MLGPGDDPSIPDDIVRTSGLTKRYGDFDALSDCSVRVARGEVFGLLGPNGAGKTTLIRSLLGYLRPTSGTSQIDGIDPQVDGVGLRSRVAYLPGDARLPRHMRGGGVLKFFSEIHPAGNLDRSAAIAEQLELNTRTRVAFMSTGMRQKLALSVVLGLETPLLILDEPTANLDPTVRAKVLDLVVAAQQRGRTVMFSSHVLSEIEETCDRVAFLRKGRLVHQLTISDLFQRHRVTAKASPDFDPAAMTVPSDLRSKVQVSTVKRGGQPMVCIDTAGDLAPLLTWIDSLRLAGIRIEPLGLRAVYDAVHFGDAVHLGDAVSAGNAGLGEGQVGQVKQDAR
ncbi:putative ABC transporter ATP-binding protein YbhF [Rubripirellula lacrimiformis]|uniref:Putative ABC transporter ATP-binding protein YbhF n=1 Tax=Rubripirellula lacrimiformis TaxID=1930273 RepID=A0A517NGE1_9BACT|nr:ABC transporter ATP-binding protein [Rubripirellula lacrimiformis]QDT06207.1 putative ABC transporter ATP-binding protein YbhF [Rubripirellula lacrimiformis]